MHSCNVYMFEMAQAVGYEPIYEMAQQFGFGQYAGLFPDLREEPAEKDLKYGNLPANQGIKASSFAKNDEFFSGMNLYNHITEIPFGTFNFTHGPDAQVDGGFGADLSAPPPSP